MTDTAEDLLEEAEDLIACPADNEERSRVKHTVDCPWCEWRRRYQRFKAERENARAANLARMMGV